MKLGFRPHSIWPAHPAARPSGYTLTGTLVAASIFIMVIGGVMVTHLLGLRIFEITQAKLAASEETSKALNLLIGEIRSAKIVRVGNGDLTSFTPAGVNTAQRGNAIQIYPSTNMDVFIRYFLDTNDETLKRMTNGSFNTTVVSQAVTNQWIFSAEDHAGNLLTNRQNNCVIALSLDFDEAEMPKLKVSLDQYYTSYQVRGKITHRTLE